MTDHITIPRALLEQALEALDNTVDVVYEEYTEAVQRYANIPSRKARLDRLAAMAKAHLDTSEAIRSELAKPEASHTAMQLAAMVLSDCGISTDHTALHERVAKRITRHEEQLIDSLQKLLKPVTDVAVTKNKSGQIVAVTLQDEDGRVLEMIEESTPTPAWHDAPTRPGLWLSGVGTAFFLTDPAAAPLPFKGCRWYGPIPQDDKAEGDAIKKGG